MSQYVVREGLDSYLRHGKPLFGRGNTVEKISAVIWFAIRYLRLYFSFSLPRNLSGLSNEALLDLKFVEKHARKLARAIIICSGKYQAKMAHKQLMIDRLFWIAAELYAITAAWSYALEKRSEEPVNFETAPELAEMYGAMAKRRIKNYFALLWNNDDAHARIMAKNLLSGRYDFIHDKDD